MQLLFSVKQRNRENRGMDRLKDPTTTKIHFKSRKLHLANRPNITGPSLKAAAESAVPYHPLSRVRAQK